MKEAVESASNALLAPWEKPDGFPPKPLGQDYGYILGGKWIACSQAELIERCASGELPAVKLAWCPESPHAVPVFEIPFLWEAIKARSRHRHHASLRTGLLHLALWSSLGAASGWQSPTFPIFVMLALLLGVAPIVQARVSLNRLGQYNPEIMAAESPLARYELWVATRTIVFTYALLAAVTIVAFSEVLVGLPNAIPAAGLVKEEVWQGQYWRLLTAATLHGGFLHFGFNSVALLSIGRLAEALAGAPYLAFVFVLSALNGNLFSLVLIPAKTSIGASGGLMGLIGFLTILGQRRQHHLPPGFVQAMAINIALVAIMGVLAYQVIDNANHLGGLLCGLVCGWRLVPKNSAQLPLTPSKSIQIAGWLALTAFVLAAVLAVWKLVTAVP